MRTLVCLMLLVAAKSRSALAYLYRRVTGDEPMVTSAWMDGKLSIVVGARFCPSRPTTSRPPAISHSRAPVDGLIGSTASNRLRVPLFVHKDQFLFSLYNRTAYKKPLSLNNRAIFSCKRAMSASVQAPPRGKAPVTHIIPLPRFAL